MTNRKDDSQSVNQIKRCYILCRNAYMYLKCSACVRPGKHHEKETSFRTCRTTSGECLVCMSFNALAVNYPLGCEFSSRCVANPRSFSPSWHQNMMWSPTSQLIFKLSHQTRMIVIGRIETAPSYRPKTR